MTREILKIIAMITMLIDHTAFVGLAGSNWLIFNCIGRIAFPIFAFQVALGYNYTKNKNKYLLTLFGFALLSEIPYNLVRGGIIYPFSQNVIFTFVLGILFIKAIDKFCKYSYDNFSNILKNLALGVLILFIANIVGFITFVDYFGFGVIMVVIFYLTMKLNLPNDKIMLNIKYIQIFLIFTTIAIICDSIGGMFIVILGMEVPTQMFAVFSVIPIAIHLLTGQKKLLSGNADVCFKYFGYLFYPLHLIILYLIAT